MARVFAMRAFDINQAHLRGILYIHRKKRAAVFAVKAA
jgi:hypothetical protein